MRSYGFALISGLFCISFTFLASAASPGVSSTNADAFQAFASGHESQQRAEMFASAGESQAPAQRDFDDRRSAQLQDDGMLVAQAASSPSESSPASAASEEASDSAQAAGTSEEVSYPRFYSRAGFELGYGRLGVELSDEPFGTASYAVQGLNLGLSAALGVRLSRILSLHANFGIRRLFLPSEKGEFNHEGLGVGEYGFRSVDYKVQFMNIGLGATLEFGGVLLSASLGAGSETLSGGGFVTAETNWGFSWDFLVGYGFEVPKIGKIGAGLHIFGIVASDDLRPLDYAGYTIGPQFFISY